MNICSCFNESYEKVRGRGRILIWSSVNSTDGFQRSSREITCEWIVGYAKRLIENGKFMV